MCKPRLSVLPPLVGYPIWPIAVDGADAMSDSEGDNAMAYFLPNGIADDSPPKRRYDSHSLSLCLYALRLSLVVARVALTEARL